jgi:hypothetical protein
LLNLQEFAKSPRFSKSISTVVLHPHAPVVQPMLAVAPVEEGYLGGGDHKDFSVKVKKNSLNL